MKLPGKYKKFRIRNGRHSHTPLRSDENDLKEEEDVELDDEELIQLHVLTIQQMEVPVSRCALQFK